MGNSTGYGSKTTAEQALNNKDLKDNVIIVTGANTGIGKETARVLVKYGGKVVMACRSQERGSKAREEIINSFKTDEKFKGDIKGIESNLDLILCDLGSLASVKKFCREFTSKYNKLHYLINNAGVMAVPEHKETTDGFEMQFGINHIGHSYLTLLLTPTLINSKPSRVIVVSSSYHSKAPNPFGKYLQKLVESKSGPVKEEYGDFKNYGISKAANVVWARDYHRIYSKQGVSAYSLHPGVIPTDLSRHMNSGVQWVFKNLGKPFLKTIPQGAATSVRLVGMTDEEIKDLGGHYFFDCNDKENEVRKDMKPGEEFDKISKQFYDLTIELIKSKGFSLNVDEEDKIPEKKEENKEETKENEPKTEEAKEEVKQEEPKTEEPKTEEPKQEEQPKEEEPKTEEPKEEPKTEEPKVEEPKTEEPKVEEEPKEEEPKEEEPKQEEEQPKEEPQTEENNES